MHALAAALLGALVSGASTLVGKVLLALGIGYASYTALNTVFDQLKGYVLSGLGSLSGTALQIAGLMQIDTAISMVLSAVAARMVLNGIQGGTLKRFINK